MKPGDDVIVENLDGETAEGELVAELDETAGEYELPIEVGGRKPTVAEYWRGKVEPDDPLVQVRLGETTYTYPASKVEEVE